MTWILLGLALWLLQDLCHDFWEGPEQFCTAIPLEKMWWCLPFQLWKISQGNLQETINKTKSTESGWDRVRFLVAACTVLCSRFVANTILVTQLPFWTVFSQHPGLLCFSLCHSSEEDGGGQDVERGHNKADVLSYQGDIPHRIMLPQQWNKEEGV